jgi:hypothetical protein
LNPDFADSGDGIEVIPFGGFRDPPDNHGNGRDCDGETDHEAFTH